LRVVLIYYVLITSLFSFINNYGGIDFD